MRIGIVFNMAYLIKRLLYTMKVWQRLILMMTLFGLIAAVGKGEEAITNPLFGITSSSTLAEALHCGKGEFRQEVLPGRYACFPCPDNTYQDEEFQSLLECKPCKTFHKHIPSELKTKNCTTSSNAEFVCADGHFNYKRGSVNECKNCKICALQNKYTGRNCTNTTDTVCCEHPDMVVVKRESDVLKEFVCVNQSTISTTGTTSAPITTTTTTKEISNCDEAVFRSNGCRPGEFPVQGCETQGSGVLCKPSPGRNESSAPTLSTIGIVCICIAVLLVISVALLVVCRRRIKSACMKICNRNPNQYIFRQPRSATNGSVGSDSELDTSSELLENSKASCPV